MSKSLFFVLLSSLLLSACASGTFKARQEQREKIAASAGLFCEFISGDLYPDVDVELNMSMARRCDVSKNFSITNFKNSSDEIGMVYCCATRRGPMTSTATPASPASKKDEKAENPSVE